MVTCRFCGHQSEVSAITLRERLPPDEFVKHIGMRFRCNQCGRRGAEVDARRALGYYG
jgi:hypothetical protein